MGAFWINLRMHAICNSVSEISKGSGRPRPGSDEKPIEATFSKPLRRFNLIVNFRNQAKSSAYHLCSESNKPVEDNGPMASPPCTVNRMLTLERP